MTKGYLFLEKRIGGDRTIRIEDAQYMLDQSGRLIQDAIQDRSSSAGTPGSIPTDRELIDKLEQLRLETERFRDISADRWENRELPVIAGIGSAIRQGSSFYLLEHMTRDILSLADQRTREALDRENLFTSIAFSVWAAVLVLICYLLWRTGRRRWFAEEAVRKHQENLEGLVKERTSELVRSREKLQSLAHHLQAVREEERSRIARELHDDVAQSLTAVKMDLLSLGRQHFGDKAALEREIVPVVDLVDQTIQTTRTLCVELRHRVLDDQGLKEAAEWCVETFRKRTGLLCSLAMPRTPIEVDKTTSTEVFRVLQEALANVATHADAPAAGVEIAVSADTLTLQIRDEGKGITSEQLSDPMSFGIMGIIERARALGGEADVTGVQGKGTTVRMVVPLQMID